MSISGASIISDPAKGRCLVAANDYAVGDVIFEEKAFLYASCSEDDTSIDNGDILRMAFTKKEMKMYFDICSFLADLSQVKSFDTARNLILMIAFHRLSESQMEVYLSKMLLLQDLTASNLDACIADVKLFHEKYPSLFTKTFSYSGSMLPFEKVGWMLGVLNTNQLELEDFAGSGLFVWTAIMEHQCNANCSYTTKGTTVFMTAIAPISAGDRLSIDYGNHYYHPTTERVTTLLHSYGFVCDCPMCVGPDFKRGFLCSHCFRASRSTATPVGDPTKESAEGIEEIASSIFIVKTPMSAKQKKNQKKKNQKKKKAVVETPSSDDLPHVFEDYGTDMGAIYPIVRLSPDDSGSYSVASWTSCEKCHQTCTPEQQAAFLAYESSVQESLMAFGEDDSLKIDSLVSLDKALISLLPRAGDASSKATEILTPVPMLHPSHHLLYWFLSELSMSELECAQDMMDRATKSTLPLVIDRFEKAIHIMLLCGQLLDHSLPSVHYERVMFFDRLGQLYVSASEVQSIKSKGYLDKSHESFNKAYQMAMKACGVNVPITKSLHELAVVSPPTAVLDLMNHYRSHTGGTSTC